MRKTAVPRLMLLRALAAAFVGAFAAFLALRPTHGFERLARWHTPGTTFRRHQLSASGEVLIVITVFATALGVPLLPTPFAFAEILGAPR